MSDEIDLSRYGSGGGSDEIDFGQYQPQAIPSGVKRRKGSRTEDALIDIGKGLFGLAEIPLAAADWATGGDLGVATRGLGIDTTRAKQTLERNYSAPRVEANENVAQAEGFVDSAIAYAQNPSTIVGGLTEAAPGMIGLGAIAGGAKTALGALGRTSAGTSLLSFGSIGTQIADEGGDVGDALLPAAAIGLGTFGLGRMGMGNLEAQMGSRAFREAQKGRSAGTRTLLGLTGEGGQETGEGMIEQAGVNRGTGKPLDEGLGKAAAGGLMTGGPMGAATNLAFGKRPDAPNAPNAPAAPPSAGGDIGSVMGQNDTTAAALPKSLTDVLMQARQQQQQQQQAAPAGGPINFGAQGGPAVSGPAGAPAAAPSAPPDPAAVADAQNGVGAPVGPGIAPPAPPAAPGAGKPAKVKPPKPEDDITDDIRNAIWDKYGVSDNVNAETQEKDGFVLFGKPVYTPDDLTKQLNKLALVDSKKPPMQLEIEDTLSKTMKGLSLPIESGTFTSNRKFIEGAAKREVTIGRLKTELEKEQARGEDKADFKKVEFFTKWIENLGGTAPAKPAAKAEDAPKAAETTAAPAPAPVAQVAPASETANVGAESIYPTTAVEAGATMAPPPAAQPAVVGQEAKPMAAPAPAAPAAAAPTVSPGEQAKSLLELIKAGQKLTTEELAVIGNSHEDPTVRKEYERYVVAPKVVKREDGYTRKLNDEEKEAELQRVEKALYLDPTVGRRDERAMDLHAEGKSGQEIADIMRQEGFPEITRQQVQAVVNKTGQDKRRKRAYDSLQISKIDREVLDGYRGTMEDTATKATEAAAPLIEQARPEGQEDTVDRADTESMGGISSIGGSQGETQKASAADKWMNATPEERIELELAEKATEKRRVSKAKAEARKQPKNNDDIEAEANAAAEDKPKKKITLAPKPKKELSPAAAKVVETIAETKAAKVEAIQEKVAEVVPPKPEPVVDPVAEPVVEAKVEPKAEPKALTPEEIEARRKAGLPVSAGRAVKKAPKKETEAEYETRMKKVAEEVEIERKAKLAEQKSEAAVEKARKYWDKTASGEGDLDVALTEGMPKFDDLSADLQEAAAVKASQNKLNLDSMQDIFTSHLEEKKQTMQSRTGRRLAAKIKEMFPEYHEAVLDRLGDFIIDVDADLPTTLEESDLPQMHHGVVDFMGSMAGMGLYDMINNVRHWDTVDLGEDTYGHINSFDDGTYSIEINTRTMADIEDNNGMVGQTLAHEFGHALDGIGGSEGIYSGQPEMTAVRRPDGSVTGLGAVSREVINAYKQRVPAIRYLMEYPLDKSFASYNNVDTQREMFAQLFAGWANPDLRKQIEQHLPRTAAYMKEVIDHASAQKTVRRLSKESAVKRQENFYGRNAESGRPRLAQSSQSRQGPTTLNSLVSGRRLQSAQEVAQRLHREFMANGPITPVPNSRIDANIARLPTQLQAPVASIATTMGNLMRRGVYVSSMLHDLADNARATLGMTSVQKFADLISMSSALKAKLDEAAGDIGRAYMDLTASEKEITGQYLLDATREQKWGYVPDWKQDAVTDEGMVNRHNRLPPAVKKVVEDTFKHNEISRTMINGLIIDQINEQYDAALANTPEADQAKLMEDRDTQIAAIEDRGMDGPYTPLQRVGNFVTVGKSDEYHAAEELAESTGKYTDLIEMRSDPRHYSVSQFNTAGEARMAAQKLRQRFPNHTYYEGKDAKTENMHTASWKMMSEMKTRLMDSLGDDDATAAYRAKISDMMRDMYIETLTEQSLRRNQLRRDNVDGVKPEEMMGAFLSRSRGVSHFIANATNEASITQAMLDMRKEVRDPQITPDKRAQRKEIYDEVSKRRMAMTTQVDTPIQNKLMAFTGIHRLLTSPAYYLQYITQPLTMYLPAAAARHGYFRALGEASTATRDVLNMAKRGETFDFAALASRGEAGAREAAMLQKLMDSNAINVNQGMEFGDPNYVGSAAWNKGIQILSKVPHTLEAYNRIGSALATYRMMYEDGIKARLSPEEAGKAATKQALTDLRTTYGDYDSMNAPRLMMQGGVFKSLPIKLITQFRKFQVIHMALMGRLLYNALKNTDPTARKIALKQLGFMAGHYSVFAGAMGIPLASLMVGVVKALTNAFDDEEDLKEDQETWLRRMIDDEDLATLVINGVPAALGVDVSGSTGAGDIASIFREGTGASGDPRRDYSDYLQAALGPFIGSVLPMMYQGTSKIASGEYYDGLKQLAPKGVSNIMKAYNQQTEGIVNSKGDVTISSDELSFFDTLMQGLGAPSTKITDANRVRNASFNYEQQFSQQTNSIKKEYTAAMKEGDYAAAAEARQKWTEMQTQQGKVGVKKAPISLLMKSVQKQQEREAETIEGVQTSDRNRSAVETLSNR